MDRTRGNAGRRLWPGRWGRWLLGGLGAVWHFPGRRPWRFFWLLFGLVVVTDAFDSFGLDDTGERALAEVVDAFAGPSYGLWSSSPRRGQASVIVVLINQATLDSFDLDGPPLPYYRQVEILKRVSEAAPRAIFFDVFYPRPHAAVMLARRQALLAGDKHPDDEGLAALGDHMAQIGCERPLFIGPIGDDAMLAPLRAALVDRRGPAQCGAAAGGPDDFARGVRQAYIDVDPAKPREYIAADPDGTPSAAFALYRSWCATKRKPRCALPRTDLGEGTMIVRWGYGASDWRNLEHYKARGSCGRSGWRGTVDYVVRGLFRALQPGGGNDLVMGERCGYADFVAYGDLDRIEPAQNKPYAARLKDKIVLIGFDLPSGGDRRRVPFYGDVPGVMVHAMAVDNLIEMSGRPVRAPEPLDLGGLDLRPYGIAITGPGELKLGLDSLDMLQYGFALLVVLTAVRLAPRIRRMFRVRDTRERRENFATGVVLVALGLCGLAILIYGILHNWPLAAIFFGGLLPGGVLSIVLLLLLKSGMQDRKEAQ